MCVVFLFELCRLASCKSSANSSSNKESRWRSTTANGPDLIIHLYGKVSSSEVLQRRMQDVKVIERPITDSHALLKQPNRLNITAQRTAN